MSRLREFVVDSDRVVGDAGGFLGVRRMHLRNRREDGTTSPEYICDFIVRPKGLDAVVVCVYRRGPGGCEVLMREGLRPALYFGRDRDVPIAEGERSPYFAEVVAGIIEQEDKGEAGVRARGAAEVFEEAGYRVDPDHVELLGACSFPSPGVMPEKYYLMAAEVSADAEPAGLEGDGSPMEEGARTRWIAIDDAIAAFVSGELEDLKSEVTIRRLRERL